MFRPHSCISVTIISSCVLVQSSFTLLCARDLGTTCEVVWQRIERDEGCIFSGNGKSSEITRLSFKFLPLSHCARSVYYRKAVDLVSVTSISGKHLNATKYSSGFNRTESSTQLIPKPVTRQGSESVSYTSCP